MTGHGEGAHVSGGSREAGAATVFGLALIAVLVLVAAGGGVAAAVLAGHRRAEAGADLAAVAGATAVQAGQDGCAAAARIAAANGADLDGCTVDGVDVVVSVRVTMAALQRLVGGAGLPTLPGRARGGPDPG